MKALFDFLLVTVLPCAAFYGGWILTGIFFEKKFVPLPSEATAVAVGAGCFFWTLSVLMLFVGKRRMVRQAHHKQGDSQ